jgi:hypothetical protein
VEAVQAASASELVMVTTRSSPAAAGVHAVEGEIVKVDVAPSCVTDTACPAIVAVAVRGNADAACADAVRVIVALPLPLAGDTVSQPALDDVLHVAPATRLVRVTDVLVAAAVGVHVVGVTEKAANDSPASAILIRGKDRPVPASKIDRPVVFSEVRTASTDADGRRCFNSTHAPATCGAAIDVPLLLPVPPPGTGATMPTPGANSCMPLAVLLKFAT